MNVTECAECGRMAVYEVMAPYKSIRAVKTLVCQRCGAKYYPTGSLYKAIRSAKENGTWK